MLGIAVFLKRDLRGKGVDLQQIVARWEGVKLVLTNLDDDVDIVRKKEGFELRFVVVEQRLLLPGRREHHHDRLLAEILWVIHEL